MTNRPDIQLVDDQLENLKVLRKMLAHNGYRVRASLNGELALTSAFQVPPDLILLDILMPGLDGYEVCRRLKADERTRDVPVLFLSALDGIEDKSKAFAAGGVDYINKPFQAEEVLARVATHLTLRDTLKQLEAQNTQMSAVNRELSREIAERKEAEQALAQSAAQYHHLLIHLNAGVVVHGPDRKIRFSNIAATQLLGLTDEEMLGKDDQDPAWYFLREDGTPMPVAEYPVNQVLATGQSLEQYVAGIVRKGEPAPPTWVLVNAFPEFYEKTELQQVVVTFANITRRRQVEHELRASERLLHQIAANYPNSYVSIIEKDLTIGLTAGQEFTKRNLAPDQFVGLTLEQVFGEHAPVVKEQYLKTFNGDVTEFELFIDNQHQLYQAVPLFDDRGRINRILAVARNITDRKLAENKIIHLNAVLRAIRHVNQLIVREKDPHQLIEQSCRLLTETRGYHHAWIALLDQTQAVTAVAEAGLDQAFNPMHDYLQSGSPVLCMQRALTQPGIVSTKNTLTDCPGCPLAGHYQDSAATTIRLEHEGVIYGVLTVAVPVSYIDDAEERDLLEEIAGDIALALHGIELEARRKQAEEALRESEEKFRQLAENSPELIYRYRVSPTPGFEYVSPSATAITGYTPEEHYADPELGFKLVHPDDRVLLENVMTGLPGSDLVTLRWQRKDGAVIWTEQRNVPINDVAGNLIAIEGIARDVTERKQAELALRVSEEKFRTITEQMTDMVFVTDTQGTITYASPAVESIFGLTPDKMQGHLFMQFLVETEITKAVAAFSSTMSTGMPAKNLVLEMKRKDGATFWGDLNATFYQKDDFVGTIGLIRDITDRKRNEAINAARLHLLQFSISHSLDELLEETLNEAEKLTGSLVGFYHFVDDDQQTLTLQQWSTGTKTKFCRAEGKGMHYNIDQAGVWVDCIHQRKPVIHNDYAALSHRKGLPDGHTEVTRELVVPVFRGDKISAILGVGNKPVDYTPEDVEAVALLANLAWEIAVRKRAEESLRLLNQAIEQSPVSVVITDIEGLIQYVNPKFTQMTGYSAAEAIGQTPRILKSDRYPPAFYRDMWDTLIAGQEWRGEFCNRKKNGELYWELASITGVKNPHGKIIHYVGVKEEITQRKKREEEHVRQERLAAVGQLAAGIAHDFNNILTSIIGFAELLRLNPNAHPDLGRIVEQGQRAAQLTRQILDFSRQTVNAPRPLDMRAYLNETLKFIERTIPESVQIRFNFERGDYTINADPVQLQQVIANLAVNTRDAMPGGGTLYFDLARFSLAPDDSKPCPDMAAGEWIRLAVTDTGSGIEPEILPHIFEPFFTTKEVGQGTGLGLAQIYGIVMQHNGCITVNSRLGEGTTFTLYFPAFTTPTPVENEAVEVIPRGRGETILLVEDNPTVLDVTQSILETLNYRVLTAEHGAEALSAYRSQPDEIALVLTDAVMPEMDGYALAAALQTEAPDLPVLLFSGYAQNMEIPPEIAQIVVSRLQKPLNIQELARALDKVLRKR